MIINFINKIKRQKFHTLILLPASRKTVEKSKGHNRSIPSSDPVAQNDSFTQSELIPSPNSVGVVPPYLPTGL